MSVISPASFHRRPAGHTILIMIRNKSPRRSRAIIFGSTTLTSVLVAVFVLTVNPASADSRTVVALGDSFTSGEGAPPFEAGTDTRLNKCHRSTNAYPIVAARLIGAQARNVACSSAQTRDLFTTFRTESAQVSRIGDATDVLVTIGGNDINAFEAALTLPPQEVLNAELAKLKPTLVQTYTKIKAAAPKARVFVVGYPAIFAIGEARWCLASQTRREYIVNGTKQLDEIIRQAAMEANVGYIDAFSAFSGHELCTAQPYVNSIDVWNIRYSLHPNAAGQNKLGEIVAAHLKTTSSSRTITRVG